MCTSDGLDACTAPGFWHTPKFIAEVRTVQIEAGGPEMPVVLLGDPAYPMRRHDVKFDKGTI